MRIVHVADSFAPDIGGIERQVETLVRQQMAAGHDVTVITAVGQRAELDLELDVVRAAGGRWLTVMFPWRNRQIVAAVLDGRKIDVLHAHFTVISPIAIYVTRAAGRRGIPVAATVHSLWWRIALATRVSTLPFGWGRMRAAWSGVSSIAAEHVRRTLIGVREVSVVPNMVDTRWWATSVAARAKPTDCLKIVVVGRLKKRKHVDEFINVLAEVRTKVPAQTKVSVSIVGDGPRKPDLQRQIDRHHLSDWVSLLGYRDPAAVREIHQSSHLFVASSRQEAFGIAALEARSAGLPIVGYTGNGLIDYVTTDVDGVLVHDRGEMVRALTELVVNPDRLTRMLATTTTTAPAITTEQAIAAVGALYERARGITQADHQKVA